MALIKPVKGFSVDALTEEDLTALASALGVEKADLYNMITKGGELTSGGLDSTNDYFPLSDASAAAAKRVNLYQLTAFFKSHLGTSSMAKVKTGSYTGTGTYGYDNKCSINVGFQPSVVIICPSDNSVANFGIGIFIYNAAYGPVFDDSYFYQMTLTWSGNTVYWCYDNTNASAKKQLNYGDKPYRWVAIG